MLHEGAPYLGAGQSVTTGFLERLARGLGASLAPEVLPANILSRTPELIVWWSPEKHRLMFFGDGNKDTTELNGRMYPHPALVFMVNGRELFVRALGENRRPTADTRLKNAPYWNTDAHGRVCLGSMRVPEEVSACSLSAWEDAYFASEFTHPSGAVHLTTHPGGFLGLWSKFGRAKPPVSSQVSCRCEPNAAGVCAETRGTMKPWKHTIFIQSC